MASAVFYTCFSLIYVSLRDSKQFSGQKTARYFEYRNRLALLFYMCSNLENIW